MEVQTIIIKIKDGDPLLVSKNRLTKDSRMFTYLIEELKYDELDLEDFSTKTVSLFLTLLDDRQLGEIEDEIFRELHKIAKVFEVNWLRERCCGWLKCRMDSIAEDNEIKFLFDECWYIFNKWEDKEMTNELVSSLALKDNSSFISDYMSDLDKLETGQIDLLVKLGRSNTDHFLQIILHNLSGQNDLNEKVRYLLENINLALCCERNEELYLEVFEVISNLSGISVADLKSTHQLTFETTRFTSSRRVKRKSGTCVVYDVKEYSSLLDSCKTLNDITKAVGEGRITSMLVVVDVLMRIFLDDAANKDQDTVKLFVTALTNICSVKELKKVSRYYLDIIITALNCSTLKQSGQLITLLKELKKNEKLCTHHEIVTIKRHKVITVTADKEYKELFKFKHPGTGTCTESDSTCGFILRYIKHEGNITHALCTQGEDYKNTELHYHDVISARDMDRYWTLSGTTPAGNKVTVVLMYKWWGEWLPDITDWKYEAICVDYNVADYLVAKRN